MWLIRRRVTPVATTVPFPGTVIDTPKPVVHVAPIVPNETPSPEAIRDPGLEGPVVPLVPFVPFVPGGPRGPVGPGAPFVPFVPFVPGAPGAPKGPGTARDRIKARIAMTTAPKLSHVPIFPPGADTGIGCGDAGTPPPYEGCMRVIALEG